MTTAQAARALQLLCAVQQLFDKIDDGYETPVLAASVIYDGAEHDGFKLDNDITTLLDEIDGEQS